MPPGPPSSFARARGARLLTIANDIHGSGKENCLGFLTIWNAEKAGYFFPIKTVSKRREERRESSEMESESDLHHSGKENYLGLLTIWNAEKAGLVFPIKTVSEDR